MFFFSVRSRLGCRLLSLLFFFVPQTVVQRPQTSEVIQLIYLLYLFRILFSSILFFAINKNTHAPMNQLFIFANKNCYYFFGYFLYKVTATIRDNRWTNPVNFQLTSKKVAIETEVTITDQKQKKITLCPFLWINFNISYIRRIFLKREKNKVIKCNILT